MKLTKYASRGVVVWPKIVYLALIVPLSAFAQNLPKEKAREKIDEEVVKLDVYEVAAKSIGGYGTKQTLSQAGKLKTALLNTAQLIVVANKELMDDINIGSHDVLQAVQMITGGVLMRSPQASDDFTIWGFRSANVLRDGIYVGTYAQAVMYDVDRIEVVKGPITATYGHTAPTYAGMVGGAINIVTRRPTKEPTTETKFSFGSYKYMRGELHVSRPVTDNFRYRVDVGAMHSDYGPRRFQTNSDAFLGTGLVWDVSSANRVNLDLTYFTSEFEYALTFLDSRTRKVFVAPEDFTVNTNLNNTKSKNFRGILTFNSDFGNDFTMTAFVGWVNFSWSYYQGYPLDGPNWNTGLMQRNLAYGTTRRHNWYIQEDFSKKFKLAGTNQQITWGALFEANVNNGYSNRYSVSDLNVFNYKAPETIIRTPKDDSPYGDGWTQSWGAYVQDSMNLYNENLFVTGSLRFNGRKTTNQNQVANYLSKRIGVTYMVTKGIGLYYNNAEGVMFGGGLDTYGRAYVPSLGVEKSFGVKTDLMDGLLTLSGTRFSLDLTNVFMSFVQGPGDPQPGFPGIKQSGTHHNEGWEIDASSHYKVRGGVWDLIGAMYHGDMKNHLKMRPVASVNNTTSLFAKYSVTAGELKGLALGMGGNWIGQSNIANFASDYVDQSLPIRPAYATYSAMISFTTDNSWRYQLNVNNLTDSRHIQGAEHPNWVYTDPGRIIRASVDKKF